MLSDAYTIQPEPGEPGAPLYNRTNNVNTPIYPPKVSPRLFDYYNESMPEIYYSVDGIPARYERHKHFLREETEYTDT